MLANLLWIAVQKTMFQICRSGFDYAANKDDMCSRSGGLGLLKGCPITFRSSTQKFVTLSVKGHVVCLQAFGFYWLVHGTSLFLEMDNKGAVDLANTWGVGV